MVGSRGFTYIALWNRSKPYVLAIFNDGPAHAGKVDIHIIAIVHPHLPTRNHHNRVLDVGKVCCACDLPSHNERICDVFQCQAGEGLPIGGRYGHIHDAFSEVSEGP